MARLSFHIAFFFALCLALLCKDAVYAQTWEKKQEVNGNITFVGFNPYSPNSQVGYFGVTGSTFEFWRTSDAGETWTKVTLPLNAPPVDMTFKDAMTGWMVTGLSQFGSVYKTTDGGLTWIKQPLDQSGSAIKYVHSTRLLFVSVWEDASVNASYVSSNEGASWTPFHVDDLNGYTFSDGERGMAAVVTGNFIRTTNGGQTWEPLNWTLETWQPLAIANTNTYFIASEANEVLYRSDDHGSTWQLVRVFPATQMNLTGDLKGDLCGMIVQAESLPTTDTSFNGFLISQDEGVTWAHIGGPPNVGDTRFDLVGKTIYAGESGILGDNIPSGLWKFTLPSDIGSAEAKLTLTFPGGEKMETLTPDERKEMTVRLSSAIPAQMNVGSIAFDLSFDVNAASIQNLKAHQGWSISETAIAGGLRVQLTKAPGSTIDTSPLVTFELKPIFSLTENRNILLQNVSIGSAPQQPVKCFTINSIGDAVAYDLNFNNCEDSLLLRMLDGRAPLEILSVKPNPANTSSIVSLEIASALEGEVVLNLINAQGTIIKSDTKQVSLGRTILQLTTDGVTSGAYLLTVHSNGISRHRNVVIK